MNEKELNDEKKINFNSSKSNNLIIVLAFLILLMLLMASYFAYKYYKELGLNKNINDNTNNISDTKFGYEDLKSINLNEFKKISKGEVLFSDADYGSPQKKYFEDICKNNENCDASLDLNINNIKYTINMNFKTISDDSQMLTLTSGGKELMKLEECDICTKGPESYFDVIDNKYLVVANCSIGGFGGSYISIFDSNLNLIIEGYAAQVGRNSDETIANSASFSHDANRIYYWVLTDDYYEEENRGAIKYEATIENNKIINKTPIKRIIYAIGE